VPEKVLDFCAESFVVAADGVQVNGAIFWGLQFRGCGQKVQPTRFKPPTNPVSAHSQSRPFR
jgi:hypothetical protein